MCSWFPVFLFFTKYQYVCMRICAWEFFFVRRSRNRNSNDAHIENYPRFFSLLFLNLHSTYTMFSLFTDGGCVSTRSIYCLNQFALMSYILHQVSSLFYLIKNASTINSFYTLNCTESTINWWIYIYCNVSRWILWLYTKFNNFDLVNFVANNNVWQNVSIKKLLNGRNGSDGPRILDGKISKGGFGVKAWALAHFPK